MRDIVLKSWLRSGSRRVPKMLLFVGGVAVTTIVGLIVSGFWEDVAENDLLAITVDSGPYEWTRAAVVPRPISDLPPAPQIRDITGELSSCNVTRGWVRNLGGADTLTSFTVYVEGLSDRTVILDRAEVELVRRRPPMRGSLTVSCLGASTETVRGLSVKLDSMPARVLYTAPNQPPPGSGGVALGSRPRRFLFSLTRGEVETFAVIASGEDCWCSWRLRFGYIAAGERHTVTVDNGGDPFETTGSSRAVQAHYDNGWRPL